MGVHEKEKFKIVATTGTRYNKTEIFNKTFESEDVFKDAAKIMNENLLGKACTIMLYNEAGDSIKYNSVARQDYRTGEMAIYICDGHSYDMDIDDYIDWDMPSRYLTCVDEDANDYKEYIMSVDKSVNGFNADYGRMGQERGTYSYNNGAEKDGSRPAYPMYMYWVKYYEKIAKGYTDRSELKDFDHKKEVKVLKSDGDDYAPIPVIDEAETKRIMEYLISLQKGVVEDNYDLTVPSSKKAIEESQEIINKMNKMIEDSANNLSPETKKDLRKLYIELVQVLPRKISNISTYANRLETGNINEIMEEENDLLQNFTDVYNRDHGTEEEKAEQEYKDKKNILEAFSLKSTLPTFKEQWMAEDRLLSSNGRGQDEDVRHFMSRVLKIENSPHHEKYVACCKEMGIKDADKRLLFHGSRSSNYWSIFKNNLKIFPHATNGRMFGNGLYFAELARKSLGYTDFRGSYWANGNNRYGFLLMYEVACGKTYDPEDPANYRSGVSLTYDSLRAHGYDSTYAGAGGRLYNTENIIYREDQCDIRYIIEMDANRHEFKNFDMVKVRQMVAEAPVYDKETDTLSVKCDLKDYCSKVKDDILTYDLKTDTVSIKGLDAQECQYITDVMKSNFADSPITFKHWINDNKELLSKDAVVDKMIEEMKTLKTDNQIEKYKEVHQDARLEGFEPYEKAMALKKADFEKPKTTRKTTKKASEVSVLCRRERSELRTKKADVSADEKPKKKGSFKDEMNKLLD